MKLVSTLALFILAIAPILAETTSTPPSNSVPTSSIVFNPPEGWRIAESTSLPESVKLMVVGTGANNFPPSLNLGTENFSGSLKEYLKKIKEINAAKGLEWKSLGTIKTQAGNASLSQVDSKSVWGDVRMMHVIIKHGDTIYILTAAALKEEYPKFYNEFFQSFKSLRFDP